MDQLSFVPVPDLIFGRLGISRSRLLEIGAKERFDLGDGGSFVAVEVSDFDVEVAVVVKAISGNGWCERHSRECSGRESLILGLWWVQSCRNSRNSRLVEGLNWKELGG